MRRFPLGFAIVVISSFSIQISQAAGSTSAPTALKTFLEPEGYGGSPLQRRFGNHLFVTTVINGKRGALLVDTGCPYTLINRSSAGKFGLEVQETKSSITGVTGQSQHYGVSKVSTLVMGNCTFTSVPVQVAN